jgi:hypothetical protein
VRGTRDRQQLGKALHESQTQNPQDFHRGAAEPRNCAVAAVIEREPHACRTRTPPRQLPTDPTQPSAVESLRLQGVAAAARSGEGTDGRHRLYVSQDSGGCCVAPSSERSTANTPLTVNTSAIGNALSVRELSKPSPTTRNSGPRGSTFDETPKAAGRRGPLVAGPNLRDQHRELPLRIRVPVAGGGLRLRRELTVPANCRHPTRRVRPPDSGR